jgi:hypothetical protein
MQPSTKAPAKDNSVSETVVRRPSP